MYIYEVFFHRVVAAVAKRKIMVDERRTGPAALGTGGREDSDQGKSKLQ